MGYRVKKKAKGGDVEKLLKHLKEISEKHIQIGYFQDTGDHPTAEIPFADLMHRLELNLDEQFQGGRPALQIGALDIMEKPTQKWTNEVTELFTDVGKSQSHLEYLAQESRDIVYNVFGDGNRLLVTNNPTPLDDTGELKNALTYKIEG